MKGEIKRCSDGQIRLVITLENEREYKETRWLDSLYDRVWLEFDKDYNLNNEILDKQKELRQLEKRIEKSKEYFLRK